MKNEYDKIAEDFLKKTKTTFSALFVRNGKHFADDKDNRDIYLITLQRGDRIYKFNFGQSLNASGEYTYLNGGNFKKNIHFAIPTAYDVLSVLQKHEVGDFQNFCNDFGYDSDSIKAEKNYNLVVKVYENIKMLFSDIELEKLRKIN